jgi:outer membrane cobalamin receptor
LLNSTYSLYNKLIFNIDFTGLGGMKAYSNEKKAIVELDQALDLSVKTDYLVSKKVFVFLKFNNILSSEYQLYLNYPVRGFQAMAGISCTF